MKGVHNMNKVKAVLLAAINVTLSKTKGLGETGKLKSISVIGFCWLLGLIGDRAVNGWLDTIGFL